MSAWVAALSLCLVSMLLVSAATIRINAALRAELSRVQRRLQDMEALTQNNGSTVCNSACNSTKMILKPQQQQQQPRRAPRGESSRRLASRHADDEQRSEHRAARGHKQDDAECTSLFIDVGANVGDSLLKWYAQPNCYERCEQNPGNRCVPPDPATGELAGSGGECRFCMMQAKYKQCGFEFPWWMAISHRRTYCARAFEPNPLLRRALKQQAAELVDKGFAPKIDVRTGVAISTSDGSAPFAVDDNFTVGSSLILDKKMMGGPTFGSGRRIQVQTLDAVRLLRSVNATRVALKLDVEGMEFQLLRDLLASGVLCERVDHLWVEFHGSGRINYQTLGLPMKENNLQAVYEWMLHTFQDRRIYTPQQLSPHCRTMLMRWA